MGITFTAVVVLIFLLSGQTIASPASEMRLLRTPAIHGDTIVFSYAGDLWVSKIGARQPARRLTSHLGTEIRPKISPDGRWVAFTGSYDGTSELYIMPIEGGTPRRLTFDPNTENAIGWTPDGKIAYASNAGNFASRQQRLWYIDPQGGLPIWTPIAEVAEASFLPDGRKMVYTRVSMFSSNWQRYRGGLQGKISFYDFEKNIYSELLPAGREQNYFPMVVSSSVYYISDKNQAILNLYRYDPDTKKETQLTRYSDSNIRSPSTDGKSIVWERDGFLEVYDIATGTATRQSPRILSEEPDARPVLKQLGSQISSISISPSGRRVAAEARGEIFSIPARVGDTRNMTCTSGVRERLPQWSPDGEKLAYMSDATGNWEVYAQLQLGGEATQLTQSNGKFRFINLRWSPDGKFIELHTLTNDIYILNIENRELTKVMKALSGVRSSDWSPDSRWLAMSVVGTNRLSAIYLYEVATKQLTKVTEGYYSDSSVTFDLNGKYLYFISTRSFAPTWGSFDFSLKVENADRIYLVPLTKDIPNPLRPSSDEEMTLSSTPASEVPVSKVQEAPPNVRIDLDGLAERVLPLPMPAGDYFTVIGVKNGVLYASRTAGTPGMTLDKFDLASRQSQTIFQSPEGQLAFNSARTVAAVYADHKLSVIDVKIGAELKTGQIDTNGVSALINPSEEWRQIFWEAWRFGRDNFFDPKMRGIDWTAVGRKYERYLPFVKRRADLNYVLGLMLGEIGISHAYVFGGDFGTGSSAVPVGLLGADYEAVGEHLRFKKIYYGQNFDEKRRGPLGEPGFKVQEGEYLLAIDGEPVNSKIHPNSLLINKVEKYVTLTVNSQPALQGARRVRVRAISNEENLRYAEWVEANRRYVEQKSDGRIGYMHVPNEQEQGAAEFIRGFYGQTNKDALIVDERWNTGGMTRHGFVDALGRQQRMRLSRPAFPDQFDADTIEGPKAMLINEYAGSGGDSFPYLFRKAGLGLLIGRRTMGALASIDNSLTLIDNGELTVPDREVYDPQTGDLMAENVSVAPDIDVDMRPDLAALGQDPQLDAAIKHLMQQLAKAPRKPSKDVDR